jgi:hypothetical protein
MLISAMHLKRRRRVADHAATPYNLAQFEKRPGKENRQNWQ